VLLLAADTSGKHGSIALANGDYSQFELIEMFPLSGGTFSAELVPQIARLLSRHQLSKDQIEAFVVATGPGSFTGLRVGLAAIKGLAEVLKKPIVPISLLEALALAAHSNGRILSLLDAGRNEVYVGEYEFNDGVTKMHRELLLGRDEGLQMAKSDSAANVITSDQNIADWFKESCVKPQVVERPQSDFLARMGLRKLLAGETVAPDKLEANYIRRAEAEVKKIG
jgi:tRNA threonylcarbamoyladenosine biosynthesis protein TsaB